MYLLSKDANIINFPFCLAILPRPPPKVKCLFRLSYAAFKADALNNLDKLCRAIILGPF